MLVVAIPYIWALRAGTGLFADAVLAGLLVGTLLVAAFASLGLLISVFSASNRLSLAVTFFIFVVLLAPTQLPLSGWFGDLVVQVNPMTAGSTFLQRIIVKEHAWGDDVHLLIAPVVAALVVSAVALIVAGRLRLQGSFGR
jgi:ABC-2 type transport system permease protein